MKRLSLLIPISLLLAVVPVAPSSAAWYYDDDRQSTVQRLHSENLLQTRADDYFVITFDEITSTPQVSGISLAPLPLAKYAVIVSGVVDKIITWDGFSPNDDIDKYGIVVKVPESGGIKYVDNEGVIRLAPLVQGSIVSVATTDTKRATPGYDIVVSSPVTLAPQPTGDAVARAYAPVVLSQNLNSDNSISFTINVPSALNLPSTSSVSVYVVTDGRSTNAVGLDSSRGAVTISSLPQNENVTVKTVIHDSVTNTETVIANTVVETLSANLPVLTPARSAVNDRAMITRPSVSSVTSNSDGSRTASIVVPAIPNFDSGKTWATLMVTDKNGSTTSIGTDGSAQTVDVASLGATGDYTVKVVVRDLATGQETIIKGDMIP
jgi:hypothetical protein